MLHGIETVLCVLSTLFFRPLVELGLKSWMKEIDPSQYSHLLNQITVAYSSVLSKCILKY